MTRYALDRWTSCSLFSVVLLAFHFGHVCRAELPSQQPTIEDIVEKATATKSLIRNMVAEYDVTWEWHADTVERKKAELALDPYSVRLIYDKERRFCEVTLNSRESTKRKTSFDGEFSVKYTVGSAIVSDGKQSECEDVYYVSEFLSIPLTDSDRASVQRGLFYPSGLLPPSRLPFPLPAGKAFRITSTEKIDGSDCYVLEMPKAAKYWVDPAIGYMYRKREHFYTDGEDAFLAHRYLLSDYREVIPGVWLPFKCTRDSFPGSMNPRDRRNSKNLTLHIDVRRISLNNVTDDDFKLVLPAGTLVSSPSGSYIIPGDNTVTLDQFSELARKTSLEAGGRRWMDVVLMLFLGSAVIAIFARWVVARRAAFKSAVQPK